MTAPAAVATDSRRRVMIKAAVGAGLVLAVLLGSKTLAGGGGGDSGSEASATRPSTTRTTVAAAPATPEAPAEAPVETFEVFTTKNPFVPLRTALAPAAAAPVRPVATATGAVTATPVSVASPAPAPAPAVATTVTGGQTTEPVRTTTRVALLDVFTDGDRTVANVRVNDTVSKVGAGDTFATNFRVVSLDAGERCGRFLFGDDQFRLCRGEEVLK